MRLLQKTSVKRWIWRASSSRKMKSKKWKVLILLLNFTKGPIISKTAGRPNLTYLFLSKIERNSSLYLIVSKPVLGPRNVSTESIQISRHMTYMMKKDESFTLWWFSLSKTQEFVRKFIRLFTSISTHMLWEIAKRFVVNCSYKISSSII